MHILKAENIVKTFKDGDVETKVLKGIDFDVKEGEFVAIMGRSGAGKSTFLYQVSLLDTPTEGHIELCNVNTDTLDTDKRTHFRLTHLGYVFQDYSLLPELTALENVMVPLLMQGKSEQKAKEDGEKALSWVGLLERKNNLPPKLSGGEQQRVSIARAIAHNPKILFADEPTANLDSYSSSLVIDIFKKLNKENGLTIVMVTHEEEYGKVTDRIVRLADGKIVV
jgi:putative ABC transport system ATP-binding protein